MFQQKTVLRKLQKILSGKGKLFDNQVCFYNAVFGMTNPEVFPEHLVVYMEQEQPADSGMQEKQEVEMFLNRGLDNSSSNVGKHINDDPGMGIPKYHCIHYALAANRSEICRRLTAVIRYCCTRCGKTYEEPLPRLKEELAYASEILMKTERADDVLLGVIFYEIIQTHLSERHNPDTPAEGTIFGKINLKQQLDNYYLTCDCYEFTSIDYFLALERMASRNVIASSNLAGFYYVGTEFIVKNEGNGPSGRYMVERNLEQAAFYFRQAASSDPPYAPAAYSYGYMILHGETGNLTKEERMKEAERYYQEAAEHKFHHAVSGLGDLALLRAEEILNRENPENQRKELVAELTAAIKFFHQAQQMGSFWGPIKTAQFLDNPQYRPYLADVLKAAGLPADENARDRWRAAADMGNVFAMEQLALLDLRLGYTEEARQLLEHGMKMNYPNASLHLAVRFYGEDGISPDYEKYLQCLEKGSFDGSARASLLFAEDALYRSEHVDSAEEKRLWRHVASARLLKAEEQNLVCFEKEVYEELLRYKEKGMKGDIR